MLGGLPADFSAPIVIVQHVDRAFAEGMAQWLDGQTPLAVRVAREGDRPQPGVALLAATDDHLRITRAGTLEYTREPAATPYRPSVDVFFNSLTEHWPGRVIGVLLTGMGRDGAIGLKALRMKGYHTIARTRRRAPCTACRKRPRHSARRARSCRSGASRASWRRSRESGRR